jgi:hypothetical protein
MHREAEAVECSCHWAEWGYTCEDECRTLESPRITEISCWEDTYSAYRATEDVAGFFSCLATLYANLIDCHASASCDAGAVELCFEEFDETEEDCSVISRALYDEVIAAFESCIGE